MRNNLWIGIWLGGLALLPGSNARSADLQCTASPSCDTLGYKQTSCSGKGIRCPFDKTKLFCINAGSATTPFKFTNAINQFDIVYSDGSTKSTYDANKTPIGIITHVHRNGKGDHGLMISLYQPTAQSRDEAAKQCKAYVAKGTQPGDWHLPDIGELATFSIGDRRGFTSEIDTLNNRLRILPATDRLGWSAAGNYYITYGAYNVDRSSGSYLSGNVPDGYGRYDNYYMWSSSEYPNATTNWTMYLAGNSNQYLTGDYRTYKGQFRCVAAY